MLPTLLTLTALLVSGASAITDVRRGIIPNALTFPALLLGVLLNATRGAGAGLESVAGCVLSGSLPWLIHRSTGGRAIGGGDVKLFAALGAIMGPMGGLEIELSAFIVLGVFALLRLAFQGLLLRVLANSCLILLAPFCPARYRRPIPEDALTEVRMGPAIALAVVHVTLFHLVLERLPWLL